MTNPTQRNPQPQDDSHKIFIGMLIMALVAGLVLFVVAVFFGVATPG